ncbi:winged helix-turn-helix domain-containing protein [Pelagibacterales bacterium SAG-MED03]|nr:winged helix-turn-helix domain-containing protein [Pelagibacterales bacterium SAG-MED03]
MNIQNLIIYQFSSLYQILEELDQELNFKTIEINNEKLLNSKIKNLNNYIIITKKKLFNTDNQYVFEQSPIKIFKLIEKLNVEILRKQFLNQSEININKYLINFNAREMTSKNTKLKLTEKEIKIILYLSEKQKPVSIEELQKNVWKYHSELETHTVETHIYRLRKKILKYFDDKNFIISKKNGYQIK